MVATPPPTPELRRAGVTPRFPCRSSPRPSEALLSGLLALLDDVAALAKVAASSIDDVVEQAANASVDAAGVVIDDAAVTPKYVQGFSADRELPIVWKIARGSLFNKLVLLLPAALLLSTFAPWAMQPILLLGGAYLCFEGAEKVWHALLARNHGAQDAPVVVDAGHLEEAKVRGAVRTDFVLSAEIMVVSLAAIETDSIWSEAAALAIAAVGVTTLVYGSVALLVKADDVGLHLARTSRVGVLRTLGRGLVVAMPRVMRVLATVGTGAMLWVGASILLHAQANLGWEALEHAVAGIVDFVGEAVTPALQGALRWLTRPMLDAGVGLVVGSALVGVMTGVGRLLGRKA